MFNNRRDLESAHARKFTRSPNKVWNWNWGHGSTLRRRNITFLGTTACNMFMFCLFVFFATFKEKYEVKWYWWRHKRKKWWSSAWRKNRRKYIPILIKLLQYSNLGTGLCCIVFEENQNSLSIRNGGPKFAKFS